LDGGDLLLPDGRSPPTRLYDIDWSYTNWSLLAGVEYEQ
jgi:hypothetical protein